MVNVIKRNNVVVSGQGEQVILFAHGFGCDQKAWNYIKSSFEDDYKIVMFDYVGAGNSDLTAYNAERYDSLYGYAKDILEICEELDLKEVIFVGHSVSAMIGALASIDKPDLFKKLIFIGPSPCYIHKENYQGAFDQETIDGLFEVMEEDYIGWANSLAPAIMDRDNGPELGEELINNFCSIDPVIARQFAKVTFLSDNRPDLPFIPVENLTIQSSEDMIAPLYIGQYMNDNVPNNTLVVLNAKGHCLHMSHPEETVRVIKDFIKL